MKLRTSFLRTLLLGLVLAVPALAPAHAQNKICPTPAPGDSTNKCASTAFVGAAVAAAATPPGGVNGQVQFNNSGVFGGLSNAQLTAIINPYTAILSGAVPASGGGTVNFLRADGTWAVPPNRSGYVLPSDYGITCDGTTDWHTQLQTMITASAGKTIFIPAGPACINNATTLTLPSNTTITGAGREVSTISGTALPLLTATNATNISLSNFQLQGARNVVSWSSSSFGAFAFSGNGGNYNIQYMKFSGFNSTFWGSIVAGTSLLTDVTYSNNVIKTVSADIPTDALASNNGNYGIILQSNSGGTGRIENVNISNNSIDANSMCFAILMYGNVYKSIISGNLILNDGQTTPTHCSNGGLGTQNSYGIAIYDLFGDGNPAANFMVSGNTIINPYATGIYVVGDGNPAHTSSIYNSSGSTISDNLIDGQTSQSDSTLPRGGIVVSLTTDVDIVGNKIRNSFGGVAAVGQMTGLINIEGNTCTTSVNFVASTPYCYRLGSGSNGSSNTSKHILKANYAESTIPSVGDAVRLGSSTGARFNDVEISDNTINGGWTGLAAASQFVSGSFVVKNNKFGGAANNAMATIAALTTVAAISVVDNIFDGAAGVSGNGLVFSGNGIEMVNNKFINRTSGSVAMLTLIGACGTIIGTQFNLVVQAAQVAATSLGTTNPVGCTLGYLDQVQNLTPSELGAASSKYVVDHWSHISTTASTTHLEQRVLTGN